MPHAPAVSTDISAVPRADVTQSVRHGVPHVVMPSSGAVRARLVFRVGVVDETVQQRGLTHLVEHLVMRAVGRRHVEVDGHTGAMTTGFDATGDPAGVTEFLEDVWTALADLAGAPSDATGGSADPLEAALDLERRVLRREADGRGVSPAVDSASHRFGLTGAGRLVTDELGLEAATPASVRAWVRARFVRAAAGLAATAPIEPDLSRDLGPGPVTPVPTGRVVRGGRGPVWVGQTGGTAVSVVLPASRGLDLAVGRLVLEAAERAVRHERALAYDVGLDLLPVSAEQSEVAVYAGCRPEDAAEVAGLLVAAVRALRDGGPSEPDLDLDRRRSRLVWGQMPDELETAAEWAVALLLGTPPRSVTERLLELEGRDAKTLRRTVQEAWPSLQLLVPDGADPGIADVVECRHDEPPVTGRVHRGNPLAHMVPGAKVPVSFQDSLTRGDAGLTLRLDGEAMTVRWDDVAAVVRHEDGLTVMGRDGTRIMVPDGSFLGGGAVRRQVEERVDAALFVEPGD